MKTETDDLYYPDIDAMEREYIDSYYISDEREQSLKIGCLATTLLLVPIIILAWYHLIKGILILIKLF